MIFENDIALTLFRRSDKLINFLFRIYPALTDSRTSCHLLLPGDIAVTDPFPERICSALMGPGRINLTAGEREEYAVVIVLLLQGNHIIESVIDLPAIDIYELLLTEGEEGREAFDIAL